MPPACSLLLWDGGEGRRNDPKPAAELVLHPEGGEVRSRIYHLTLPASLSVTAASLLSTVGGKHLQHLLTSCPGCSLDCSALPSRLSTEPRLGCLGMLEMVCFPLKLGPNCLINHFREVIPIFMVKLHSLAFPAEETSGE